MKLYLNSILSGKCVRTGLFVLVFLIVMPVISACGSEDKLLSELRMEDRASADGDFGSEESGVSNEVPTGGIEENDAGLSERADEFADGEASGSAVRSADAEELQDEGENAGGENAEARSYDEKICVHICGAVEKPGVYELPAGSRFYEAVEAAGGFSGEACEDYLNMAALLDDGSRLEIPTLQEIQVMQEAEKENGESADKADTYSFYTTAQGKSGNPEGEENGGSGSDSSGGSVNINTADVEELCRLPGIGEGRAKAIIEYREKQGRFQKKEDIMQVSGIGEKMYARMEENLTVE